MIVGSTTSRDAAALASLFNAELFDFSGYSTGSNSQSVRISRSNAIAARPNVEYFYIGVHNTRNAQSSVNVSLTLSAFASFTALCPVSAGSSQQQACLADASQTVCSGNGVAITTNQDPDAVDCQVEQVPFC